jgi:hypothetical protein
LQPVNAWIDARDLDIYKIAFAAGVVLVAFLLCTVELSGNVIEQGLELHESIRCQCALA